MCYDKKKSNGDISLLSEYTHKVIQKTKLKTVCTLKCLYC